MLVQPNFPLDIGHILDDLDEILRKEILCVLRLIMFCIIFRNEIYLLSLNSYVRTAVTSMVVCCGICSNVM